VPNQDGVFVEKAPGNVIGGTTVASRDVISGNDVAVYIFGGGATGNQVLGNYIGPDAGGKAGPGNRQYGVLLYNAPSNAVAQSGPQANRFYRNLIANVREFTGAVRTNQSSGGTPAKQAARGYGLRRPLQPDNQGFAHRPTSRTGR
jgi:hypothetical protein